MKMAYYMHNHQDINYISPSCMPMMFIVFNNIFTTVVCVLCLKVPFLLFAAVVSPTKFCNSRISIKQCTCGEWHHGTPTSATAAAVAAEEAMMEMTEDGPYRVIL